MVVGIFPDDFDRLVAGADQLRFGGPAVLELALEGASKKPGEHPETFSTINRIRRIALGEDGFACVGEQVAKLAPGRTVNDLLRELIHASLLTHAPGVLRSARCRRQTAARPTVSRVRIGSGG